MTRLRRDQPVQFVGHRFETGAGLRPAFTLVELVIVTVILGIFAGIAVPRFANSLAKRRVEGAVRRITSDLDLARRRAKISNVNQTVRFDPAIQEYALVGMPHPDHPAREYGVSLQEEPYRATLVSADFGGDQEIIFDIYGMPDSGGSVVIRVGTRVRKITVNAETGKASAQ